MCFVRVVCVLMFCFVLADVQLHINKFQKSTYNLVTLVDFILIRVSLITELWELNVLAIYDSSNFFLKVILSKHAHCYWQLLCYGRYRQPLLLAEPFMPGVNGKLENIQISPLWFIFLMAALRIKNAGRRESSMSWKTFANCSVEW